LVSEAERSNITNSVNAETKFSVLQRQMESCRVRGYRGQEKDAEGA
jgi:hypothetical protein